MWAHYFSDSSSFFTSYTPQRKLCNLRTPHTKTYIQIHKCQKLYRPNGAYICYALRKISYTQMKTNWVKLKVRLDRIVSLAARDTKCQRLGMFLWNLNSWNKGIPNSKWMWTFILKNLLNNGEELSLKHLTAGLLFTLQWCVLFQWVSLLGIHTREWIMFTCNRRGKDVAN